MAPTSLRSNFESVSSNILENFYTEEDRVDTEARQRSQMAEGRTGRTDIQKFYSDQCIFITGGSGFMGKVLIEKLLRACGDLEMIFVLIRSKKGKDATERLKEMTNCALFQKALKLNPKCTEKLVPIVGDISLPGLGMSEEDRKFITSKVSIIINAAATVRFDEKLPVAFATNINGVKEILELAKECHHLKAITHVSTAYSHTEVDSIEERFYDPPVSTETLEALLRLDENVLEVIKPSLLGKHPNTYCFTKAIAEDVVRRHGAGLPICILRPSIIISTYEEPMRGWSDSFYGPAGLLFGISTGVLRTMYMDTDKVCDMIPVDMCINSIIASTYNTAKYYKENQTSDIPIYNYVSGARNPLTWRQFIELNEKYGIDKPTMQAMWYYGLNPTKNYTLFRIYNFFLHLIPSLIIDCYRTVVGKKRRMLNVYNKLMQLASILFYFTMNEWKFSDSGVKEMWSSLSDGDKALFPFNIADISWDYFFETFLVGLRVYLIHDPLSTLPEARRRWNRLYYMDMVLKIVLSLLVCYLSYSFIYYFVTLFINF